MDDNVRNIETDLLQRRPFRVITSDGYMNHGLPKIGIPLVDPMDEPTYLIKTQADFLREFYPSGHAINNPDIYHDVIRYDEEKKQYYYEKVVRVSFAFQQIITVKQLTHLCGNDVQFELYYGKDTESYTDLFNTFRLGWAVKNMEIAFYEAAKSVKTTGDTAFVGFMSGGKFGWRVLSYLNGDVLYPHYDPITGEMDMFAWTYKSLDSNGNEVTTWMELWDSQYFYRFKRNEKGLGKVINAVKGMFNMSGFELAQPVAKHGFPSIPVAYYRDEDGPCWSKSQDTIGQYEVAFSQMSQNNQAYAFPIMYFKGSDIRLIGDLKGAVKAVTIPDSNGEAGFLNRQDASASFNTQLDKLYRMIYEQSFAVIPPELKSGDLPGVAIKLLYSPAYEFAMHDAQTYSHLVNKMQSIYTFGYGTEIEKLTDFEKLKVYSWIKPYIHLNETELVTNLGLSVQNGFMSKRTASEDISMYTRSNEWDRILREQKEKQQMELAMELDKEEGKARIDSKYSGGGSNASQASSDRTTDKWGNHPNEDNWDKWNQSH